MFKIPDSANFEAFSIRLAIGDDAGAMLSIAKTTDIDAWTAAQYADEILRPDSLTLIAEIDTRVAGFLLGRIVSEARAGEIYNIAVSRTERRKGIGKLLLSNAVGRFFSTGCSTIWLEVRTSNLTAIKFYENNGFKPSGRRRNFYSNPVEDAIVMRLTFDNMNKKNPDGNA